VERPFPTVRRLTWLGWLGAALGATPLVVSGCAATTSFDPVGSAATMEGSWQLAAAAASEESCAASGITHVRVRFFEEERSVDHPQLVFPCAQGSFDTRPTGVLADGVWSVRLLGLDNRVPAGADTVVASGPLSTFDTRTEGGHVVLGQIDLVP
jgi:hypothetical protein